MAIPHLVTVFAEQAPEPEDVTAGWLGLLVFLLLIAALAFLGFSLAKQLRKAQAAKDAGVFDDPDEPDERPAGSGTP